MRSQDIHPGDVIAGKYRVRAILSRNPTLVVEAFHVEFDQRVIIKLLLPGTGDDKEIERFRREARVLSKLETEHAARILDVGTQSDGTFYLVRQHVEGEDLQTYVQTYGPRPIAEAVLIVLQAAECVAETHANGIVLRELSPPNITVARRASGTPLVKITDFGTAKLMRDNAAPAGGSSLTATALFGLSPYSSPELVRKAKSVDQRADVWSLGAVLYYVLAGRAPFGGDVAQLMLAITREEPLPISSIRGDVPPDIDTILAWAMAKDVDRRFKNVHSLAHALAPYAPHEGQVLVERIAQIAHQAKQRKSGAVPPPPSSFRPPPPSSAGGRPGYNSVLPPPPSHDVEIAEGLVGEEEATVVIGSAKTSSLRQEITTGMPGAPPSFRTGGLPSSLGIAIPPPPPSIPPSPYLSGRDSAGSPADRMPRLVPPMPIPTRRGVEATQPQRSDTVAPATMQAGPASRSKKSFDMRIVWGALAATAVMLPVVLLLLLRESPKPIADASDPVQVAPRENAAPRPGIAATAAPQDTGSPAVELKADAPEAPATAAATTEPVATTQRPAATGRTRPDPVRTDTPKADTRKTADAPKKEDPPKRDPPKEDPPAASGGGSGRLLAIASGGSCSFSVDGSGRGSGSSLSTSLPAGKHTVVCKPTSGAAKSRSVTIKPNETSMLTFKL
ncbi:MAG TPA: protein kinase [Polyangiaceae bacterium]|nr:protein kinase [Polyangiaceae bacterium]